MPLDWRAMFMKKGSKPTTQVEILKTKNDKPTVIKVFGVQYIARPESEFKGVKPRAAK